MPSPPPYPLLSPTKYDTPTRNSHGRWGVEVTWDFLSNEMKLRLVFLPGTSIAAHAHSFLPDINPFPGVKGLQRFHVYFICHTPMNINESEMNLEMYSSMSLASLISDQMKVPRLKSVFWLMLVMQVLVIRGICARETALEQATCSNRIFFEIISWNCWDVWKDI